MWSWISGSKPGSSNLPVSIGDETGTCLAGRLVFKLHAGTNKANNEAVSVFRFENSPSCTPEQKSVAKAEFKRLRVLRHPNFVKYIDGVDTDNLVIIVTEVVTPLLAHIQEDSLNHNTICWGIYQILIGLKFIHLDCKTAHRNLYSSSIFVSKAGEWKIGGVAFCDDNTDLPFPSRVNQYLSKYDPPEVLRGVTTSPVSTDMWQLGVLIWEVFNGNLSSPQNLRDTSKIPAKLVKIYRELVSSNYKSRPTTDKIFVQLIQSGGYFDNSFVAANIFLNELTIKDASEKQRFFAQLSNQLDDFPPEFCKYKILPSLIVTFQYGDVGIDVLPPLFKLGKLLNEQEYKTTIIPCVIKLFSSPDRAMRIQLLAQLDNFIQYLDNNVVDQQIFPSVATGFTDTVPGMREQTVKSMLQIAPKLSEATIDNYLLKFLAKAQTDPEPPIRTNTTICISKLASYFSDGTRRKVLMPAFLRSLKDPFVHARHAGLLSLGCTIQYYHEPDIANRILPSICPILIDPEKLVREQAMKTLKLFVEKIDNHYKGIVDKTPPDSAKQPAPTSQPDQAPLGWTNWAVSSMSTITTKYMGTNADKNNKIGEITKPKPAPPPVKPVKTVEPKKPPSPEPGADNGWGDEWDDINITKKPPIPRTKSSLKLGGAKFETTAADDDDDFITSVLNEERDLLKQKTTLSMKPKSSGRFDNTPAPWDVDTPPQNQQVKLTPWDEPGTTNSDLLSSYFSGGPQLNTDDFFGQMGVEESAQPQQVKSEWDSFNLKTEESNDWDEWGSVAPSKPVAAKVVPKQRNDSGGCNDDDWRSTSPANAKPSRSSPKPQQDPQGGESNNTFDSWDSTPKKMSSNTSQNRRTTTNNKPPPKPQTDWGAPTFTPKFQPVKSRSPVADTDDWGDWDSKPDPREERRRQQYERRAMRTRGGKLK